MRAKAKLKREFLATFALVAVCLWAAIGWMLYRAHEHAIAVAAADRQNLARSLAEYEESSVRAIDLSLRLLRDEWQRAPSAFDATVARYEDYLKKEKIIQVAVTDREGYLVYSRLPQPPRSSFADREHFQVHQRRASGDELYISEPLMGRVTKQWAIQMTRGLVDQEGRFAGIVVVAVPPPGLERVYGDIHLGHNGVIALARDDGQILALTGGVAQAPRRSMAGMPGLSPDAPRSGEFRAGGDGEERFYSYRRLASYPLTVFVAQGAETVFAPYREQRNLLLGAGVIGTLLLAALAFLGVSRALERRRFLDERERLMLDLHDSCIQSIYAIGLGLENCRRMIERDPGRAAHALADAGAGLNLVIQDLRGFITGAPPPPRNEEEFLAELRRAVPEHGGPAVSFEIERGALEALNADQALHVHRIAREALSNVVRHADAKTARLSLVARAQRIHLDVSDDGRGIPSGGAAPLGLGLHHIQARAQKLGGRARVEPGPAGGTRVAVEFPRRP